MRRIIAPDRLWLSVSKMASMFARREFDEFFKKIGDAETEAQLKKAKDDMKPFKVARALVVKACFAVCNAEHPSNVYLD